MFNRALIRVTLDDGEAAQRKPRPLQMNGIVDRYGPACGIAQRKSGFAPTFRVMNKEAAKPVVKDLRTLYASAVLAFDVAFATLDRKIAANLPPADGQVAAEEAARAAVVAARRNLWAAFEKAEARIAQLKGRDHADFRTSR